MGKARPQPEVMSRLQLALNVDDLATSIAFYSKLFGAEQASQARSARRRGRHRHTRAFPFE